MEKLDLQISNLYMHTLTHTLSHTTHPHIYPLTDLTAQYNTHLLTCNFTPQSAGTQSPPPPTTAANQNGQQTDPQSITDASGGQQSSCDGNENCRPIEPQSNSDSSPDYFHCKLSLAVTCFAWLPVMVKTELNGKPTNLALVAMATRLGHVVLMGVEVPLDSGW